MDTALVQPNLGPHSHVAIYPHFYLIWCTHTCKPTFILKIAFARDLN